MERVDAPSSHPPVPFEMLTWPSSGLGTICRKSCALRTSLQSLLTRHDTPGTAPRSRAIPPLQQEYLTTRKSYPVPFSYAVSRASTHATKPTGHIFPSSSGISRKLLPFGIHRVAAAQMLKEAEDHRPDDGERGIDALLLVFGIAQADEKRVEDVPERFEKPPQGLEGLFVVRPFRRPSPPELELPLPPRPDFSRSPGNFWRENSLNSFSSSRT